MFHLIDPIVDFPHDFEFKDVHYYHHPSWDAEVGELLWLIWTNGNQSSEKLDWFYDEVKDLEYQDKIIETKTIVKGMIVLEINPYNSDEVWLKFFEVTSDYRGQKFSYEMIDKLVEVFKEKYPNKTLSLSKISDEGFLKLKNNLSVALTLGGVSWKYANASDEPSFESNFSL